MSGEILRNTNDCGFVGELDAEDRPRRSMMSSDRIPLPQDFGAEQDDTAEAQRTQSLFHINTSDIQLIEETQKEENTEEYGEKGPIGTLGVRAFKMLEILRTHGQQQAQAFASPDAKESRTAIQESEEETLITFDRLMDGCSRRVRARGFYNLINLVNAQFIRVNQTTAYDAITLTPGAYF